MAEYEYVKGQKKNVDKKFDELLKKYKNIQQKSHLTQIQGRYNQLLAKQASKKADWIDEIMIEIYRDVIDLEKKEIK